MSHLTLQINSKEALERLIGGDTETEIEIRNSVVQKFAEKHLKPIVNSDVITNAIQRIKEHANKYTIDMCSKEIATFKEQYVNGPIYDIKLRPEIDAIIKNKVREAINILINEKVEAALKEYCSDVRLTRSINVKMDHNIEVLVNQKIKEKLDAIKTNL